MADLAHPKLAIFRRVFTVLSVISMVLCLAVLVLWWRSYYDFDQFIYRQVDGLESHYFWVESDGGSLHFLTNEHPVALEAAGEPTWSIKHGPHAQSAVWRPLSNIWSIFGYQIAFGTSGPRGIAIPHCLFALAFALLPATYVLSAFRTRRRHRIGLCSACGYDLRASPGRCPECGAIGGRPEDSGRVV